MQRHRYGPTRFASRGMSPQLTFDRTPTTQTRWYGRRCSAPWGTGMNLHQTIRSANDACIAGGPLALRATAVRIIRDRPGAHNHAREMLASDPNVYIRAVALESDGG